MQGCVQRKTSEKPLLTGWKLRTENPLGMWDREPSEFLLFLICSHQPAQIQSKSLTATLPDPRNFSTPSLKRYEVLGFYFLLGELFKGREKYFATNVCICSNERMKTLGSRFKGRHLNGDRLCHFPRRWPPSAGGLVVSRVQPHRISFGQASQQPCEIDISTWLSGWAHWNAECKSDSFISWS